MRHFYRIIIGLVLTVVNVAILSASIQSNGTGGGSWTATTTWQGGVVPGASDDVFINAGDSVNIPSAVSCSNLTILSNGKLATGTSTNTVTITNNFTIQANAWYYNSSSSSSFPGATRTIDNASNYVHIGSSTVGSAGNATFGNLIMMRAGSGTTAGTNLTINGDLIMNNTATGATFRGTNSSFGSQTHTVMGNVVVNGGQWSCIDVGTPTTVCVWNVNGNVTVTSAIARIGPFTSASAVGTAIFNLNGNLAVINGARLQVGSSTTLGTGTGIINLKGNFTLSSDATLALNHNGPFAINFVGSGMQTVTLGRYLTFGSASATGFSLNDTVAAGATVVFNNNGYRWEQSQGTTGSFVVNGTLKLGATDSISGVQNFTLNPGGTLAIAHPNGITASGTTSSIQVSGTRTFDTGANYEFNGAAAQVTGNGLPTTVNNLTVNNSSGLTLSGNVQINGMLAMTNGALSLNSNTLSYGVNAVLAYNGTSAQGPGSEFSSTLPNLKINNAAGVTLSSSPTITGTLTLTNGALSIGSNTLTLNGAVSVGSGSLSTNSSSNIVVGGSGASTTLPGLTLNNLTLDRPNGAGISGNTSVNGILTLTNGVLTTGINTLSIGSGGSVSRTNGYVTGRLQKYFPTGSAVNSTFELGIASGYTPTTLTFENVTVAGNLTATATTGKHPNLATSGIDTTKSVKQYWVLSNSGISFDAYNAILNFSSGDVDAGASTGNFIAREYNGSSWAPLTTGTKTGISTQITGVTTFGDFSVGEQLNFVITASAGPNGTINPSGSTSFNAYGASQVYAIAPNSGYHVDSVIVDGVKVDSTTHYTFANIAASHTIHAAFAINQYTITASAGSHGAINPSGVFDMTSGSSKSFTFTPDAGYHVDSVLVDGVKVDSTAGYTFNNVTASHTISVVFAVNKYTIAASASANGVITPSGNVLVVHGDSLALTVTPNAHYHVDSIAVDGAKVDSTTGYTFRNVTANHTIFVAFTIDQNTITATAGANGTLSPSGDVKVNYGGSQKFTYAPNPHYQLDSVIVDGVKVDSVTSYTFTNVTSNHTIRTSYALFGLRVKSNGTGGGVWSDPSTWQGGIVPDTLDIVTILGTDSVAVSATARVGRLIVKANGRLSATSTLAVADTFALEAGALYYHGFSSGAIPGAVRVLNNASTVVYTSTSSGTVGGTGNLTFGNLVMNRIAGSTAAGNLIVNGNLTMNNSGNGVTFRATNASSGTQTVTVHGNVYVNGGQLSCVDVGSDTTVGTWNIDGDVIVNSANSRIGPFTSASAKGVGIFNIKGNLTVSGGARFQAGSSSTFSTGTGIFNLHRNFTLSSDAAITATHNGPFAVNFIGTDTQAVALGRAFAMGSASTLLFSLNDTVASTAKVVFTGSSRWAQSSDSVGSFIVNGALKLGAGDTLAGVQNFVLNNGASLAIAHPDGITASSATSSIQVTGTRTFHSGAKYEYNGAAAQVTGDGLPGTVGELIINNTSGVGLSMPLRVTANLRLMKGRLLLDSNSITVPHIVGESASSYIATNGPGALRQNCVDTVYFPVGTVTSYTPVMIVNGGTQDTLAVRVAQDTTNGANRVQLKWNIVENVAGGSNATVRLSWMASQEGANFAAKRNAAAKIFRLEDSLEVGSGDYSRQLSTEPYMASRGGVTKFGTFIIGSVSGPILLVEANSLVPRVFALYQNYPNPFNPETRIRFTVKEKDVTTLKVYDILGKLVLELFNGTAEPGTLYTVRFDASQLPSGVYFDVLQSGTQHAVQKMMLLK